MGQQDYLVVKWEVDDDYSLDQRPQRTKIPAEAFEEDMGPDEVREVICESVQEDFEQKVNLVFEDLDGAVEAALELLDRREDRAV